MQFRDIVARAQEQWQEEIEIPKERFHFPDSVRIACCYEAGRYGFWLHRYLLSCGIDNVVVDFSSIEVNRRKRCSKIDRVNSRMLLQIRGDKEQNMN